MESLKGKLTEEEALGLLSDSVARTGSYNVKTEESIIEINSTETIKHWKRTGYIKQNPVEKAEKLIKYLKNYNVMTTDMAEMIVVSEEAIQYLKKQLEEK